MSPAALDDAFKSAGHSTASFVPAISGVYLEEETVRGAILIHCRNNQLGISALVADPSAQMPSNRICLWLIDHSIGPSQALGLADEWIISTDPETQPATLRMITRLGGRKLRTLYRMETSSNAVEKAA